MQCYRFTENRPGIQAGVIARGNRDLAQLLRSYLVLVHVAGQYQCELRTGAHYPERPLEIPVDTAGTLGRQRQAGCHRRNTERRVCAHNQHPIDDTSLDHGSGLGQHGGC